MIRFEPDTWLEAFLRFFLMAAPDANIYVEISAPDLRFAAMLLLALGVALSWRRRAGSARPAGALLALLLVATAAWLATSGNGRYFMPMMLCVGPLAAGLAWLLPLTRSFRLFLAGGLLAAQAFVVVQSSFWDSWAWLPWKDAPYFQVDLPAGPPPPAPTTYVTVTSISYSLLAPQFPPASRWINITTIGALQRDRGWGQDFLAAAKGSIKLIVPTLNRQSTADGLPDPTVLTALDELLAPARLALDPNRRCELLRSEGVAAIMRRRPATGDEQPPGFWLCELRYPVDQPPSPARAVNARTEEVFARIERMCPRFFAAATTRTMPINGGSLRHYPASDTRVYVLDDGTVLYKFWRALNPVVIGTVDGVLGGSATLRCDEIRGKGLLPWDRGI